MFICLSAPGFLTHADKKKHAYGGCPHGEIYASPEKSLRPSTRNPAFPRALTYIRNVAYAFFLTKAQTLQCHLSDIIGQCHDPDLRYMYTQYVLE